MIAGQLEIQLLADVARLKQDMDKALGHVQRGAKAMQDAADQARSALAGIGAGLSAAAFAAWIKGAIDGADALNDLNKTTDIAVGQLAGLKLLAKQSGSDLEGMAKSINKLQLEIGKTPEKFAAIGVTAKDGVGAFKQLSDIFKEIKDPQMRAAVMAEALGKSWAGAAPALSEGSKRIQEIVDKGERLSGMTQGAADASDEFNDRMAELHTALGGVALKIAVDMLPLLTALAEDLTSTAADAQGLDGSFSPLTETLRALIILGGNVAFVIKGIGTEIGGMAAQIAALARGDLAGFLSIGDAMKQDADKARAAFDAWEQKMLAAGAAAKQTTAAANESAEAMTKQREAQLRAFVAQEEAKKAAEALKKELAEQAKLLAELAGLSGSFAEDWDRLNKMYAAGKINLDQLTKAQAALLAKQPAIKAAADERIKLLKAEAEAQAETAKEIADAYVAESKAREQARLAVDAYAHGIDETHQQLRFELSLKGDTQLMRDRALAFYRIELELKKQIAAIDATAGFDKEAQREEERAKARAAAAQARANAELQIEIDTANKARDQWDQTNKQIGESFVDNLMRGGKSVAQYLKDLFRTLILRPILAPAGEGFANALAVLMGGGGGGGGGGGFGSLGSFSNLFSGGASALGAFGGAASSTALGLYAGIGELSSLGFTEALTGGITAVMEGSLAAGFGTIAGVLGPIGLGIAAVVMLLSGHGETRSGGQYNMGELVTNPSGGEIGNAGQVSAITAATINATLKAIGSSSQLTNFFTGVESSEKGKGFAFAGGTLNTGGVFGQGWGASFAQDGYMNRRGSMTQEEAMKAFTTELKQATLQALQAATDVPESIAKLVKDKNIDGMVDAELDAVLNQVNATITGVMKFRAVLAGLPFETLASQSFDFTASLIEMQGGFDQAAANLAAYYDAFYSEEEKRTQLATNIAEQMKAVGLDMDLDKVLGMTRAQFRQLMDTYMAMGDAGLPVVDVLLKVAGAFASLTPVIEDVTGAVDDAAAAADAAAVVTYNMVDAGDLAMAAATAEYEAVQEYRRARTDALNEEIRGLQETIDKQRAYAATLKRFREELTTGPLAANSPEEQYRRTKAEFDRLSALAADDPARMAGLTDAGRAFLEASRAYNATSEAYFTDLASVMGVVEASEAYALDAVKIAELQLDVAKQQLAAINSTAFYLEAMAHAMGVTVTDPGVPAIVIDTGGIEGRLTDLTGQVVTLTRVVASYAQRDLSNGSQLLEATRAGSDRALLADSAPRIAPRRATA